MNNFIIKWSYQQILQMTKKSYALLSRINLFEKQNLRADDVSNCVILFFNGKDGTVRNFSVRLNFDPEIEMEILSGLVKTNNTNIVQKITLK